MPAGHATHAVNEAQDHLVDELRATLGKLELALGVVNDAIVWTDEHGRVQWCNRAFDRLVDQPHLAMLGAQLTDLLPVARSGVLLPAETHPATLALTTRVSGSGHYAFRQNNRTSQLEVTWAPVQISSRVVNAVLTIHDLTNQLLSRPTPTGSFPRRSQGGELSAECSAGRCEWLRWFSRLASGFVMLVGGLVLLGWRFDVQPLKSLSPNWVTMKPNTALGFLLAGLTLWMWQPEHPRLARRLSAQLCAMGVALIGLATLMQYLFGWNLGIDQWLFTDSVEAVGPSHPARTSPLSAGLFLCVGGALSCLGRHRTIGLSQVLSLFLITVASLASFGYLYGVQAFYQVGSFTAIAMHTTLPFIVLGLGMLCLWPHRGLMAIVTSDTAGGTMARYVLPAMLAIPMVSGGLKFLEQRVGLIPRGLEVPLFTVLTILIFTLVILRVAHLLLRLDAERQATHAKLISAYEEIQHSQERLYQAKKLASVGQLAAGVAHQVKNPLGVILQGLSYLEHASGLEPLVHSEVLPPMKQAVLRADQIVRNMLTLARPAPLHLVPGDLHRVIRATVTLLQGQLTEKRVEVLQEFTPAPVVVNLDDVQMEQALTNILSNAIHAMPDGGRLTIRTFTKHITDETWKDDLWKPVVEAFRVGVDVLVCEVADTGHGMPKEHLSHVFEPFFTTKPVGTGTGLGLSITRSIVEAHQGLIGMDSQEGQGTTVTLVFPVLQAG